MSIALVWFRQDLRITDNPALINACSNHKTVIPLYIYDEKTSVLGPAQAWWLHHSLNALKGSLQDIGLPLVLRKGQALEIILDLVQTNAVDGVYWNRCYEPFAITRDTAIKACLLEQGIEVQSSNASLLNEPWTIKNTSGDFFKVFTPYWKHCRQRLIAPPISHLNPKPSKLEIKSDSLSEWGLLPTPNWASQFPDHWTPGEQGAQTNLQEFIDHSLNNYKKNRDFPAKNATSHLSPHLHFGEIGPWSIVREIEMAKLNPDCDIASAEHFLSELGWREFSTYLLYHFPTLPFDNFKKEFNAFPWQNNEQLLRCWQKGMTGYPLVDAGMRELWATGTMHNRVRMIAASFLTKGLFIDWRLGADWFLNTLVDADLANNSASWQWVAGSGVDAAPYFRIFNPVLQSQKFDPQGEYIKRWVPELSQLQGESIHAPWTSSNPPTNYPKPLINHQESRVNALMFYKRLSVK